MVGQLLVQQSGNRLSLRKCLRLAPQQRHQYVPSSAIVSPGRPTDRAASTLAGTADRV
jgi:hypothetical protein